MPAATPMAGAPRIDHVLDGARHLAVVAVDPVHLARRQQALVDHDHAPVSPFDRPHRHADALRPREHTAIARTQQHAPQSADCLDLAHEAPLWSRQRERVQPVLHDDRRRLRRRLLRGARRLPGRTREWSSPITECRVLERYPDGLAAPGRVRARHDDPDGALHARVHVRSAARRALAAGRGRPDERRGLVSLRAGGRRHRGDVQPVASTSASGFPARSAAWPSRRRCATRSRSSGRPSRRGTEWRNRRPETSFRVGVRECGAAFTRQRRAAVGKAAAANEPERNGGASLRSRSDARARSATRRSPAVPGRGGPRGG